MTKKKILSEEPLNRVKGGIRPEDVGDPVVLPGAIESYRVCPKCGACMFPQKIRQVNGKMEFPPHPSYYCSECEYQEITTRVF